MFTKHVDRCWLLIALLLAACQSPAAIATVTPRPIPTPKITATPVSVSSVKSPDGRIRAQLVCFQGYMQWDCQTRFANGHVLFGSPDREWSPDYNYTIVCVGATHDSPCSGYQIWDMVAGMSKATLPDSPYQWDPNQPHHVLYLVVSNYEGVLDHLIDFDPATEAKTNLAACPNWFYRSSPEACEDYPGVIIGGELSGVSSNVEVQMSTYAQDLNMLWAFGSRSGNSKWSVTLRRRFGLDFSITPKADGYISTPLSYTVYISGTQAFVTDHGAVTQLKADHLDFYFEKSK